MAACRCVSCGSCNGSGHILVDMRGRYLGAHRTDDLDEMELCPDCEGSGISEECAACYDGRADDHYVTDFSGLMPGGETGT